MDRKIEFLKYLRNNSNDSQQELSKKLKRNKYFISEVENGKRNITDIVFNDILELYESEYHSDTNTENELKDIIEEYFVSIIKKDNDYKKLLKKKYYISKERYQQSSIFMYVPLMECLIANNVDEDAYNLNKVKCIQYLTYYESRYVFIFATLVSLNYNAFDNIDELKNLLNYCLFEKSSNLLPSSIAGMFFLSIRQVI